METDTMRVDKDLKQKGAAQVNKQGKIDGSREK